MYFTDEELNQLGVSRKQTKTGTVYSIPCIICGNPVYTRRFSVNRTYKCKLCEKEIVKKRNAKAKAAKEQAERLLADDAGVDYEHFHRFEKGAAKFSRAYAHDVEVARKAIGKFDSIPEVVACIELLHIKARLIVHQKVGDYTVDFCLPDEKVIIEIDGSLYHTDEAKEQVRDYAIRYMLGDGWTVRHIPADAVMKRHAVFGSNMRKMLNARREEMGMKHLVSA
jgi:very-short-patch-repair endonuclease